LEILSKVKIIDPPTFRGGDLVDCGIAKKHKPLYVSGVSLGEKVDLEG